MGKGNGNGRRDKALDNMLEAALERCHEEFLENPVPGLKDDELAMMMSDDQVLAADRELIENYNASRSHSSPANGARVSA